MKKQQNARGITARSDRPFPSQTAYIYCFKLHIIGNGPNGTNSVEALTPLGPANGSRLGL